MTVIICLFVYSWKFDLSWRHTQKIPRIIIITCYYVYMCVWFCWLVFFALHLQRADKAEFVETSNWNPLQTLILDYTWPIMTRETFLRIFKSREIMIIFPTKIVCDCLLMMMMCARKYEISVGIWDKDLTKLNLNILFLMDSEDFIHRIFLRDKLATEWIPD